MRRPLAITAALAASLVLAACGTDSDTEATSAATTSMATPSATETMTDSATSSETMTDSPSETGMGEQDIVDTAVAAGNFTTLATALTAAGLVETLKGEGPFTVFAPTDEAFAGLPAGTLDGLLEEPEGTLKDILTYHVVPGKVMAADVATMDGQKVKTVNGAELTVKVSGSDVMLMDAAGGSVMVTMADVAASNGVIHAIDGVLMPGM